VIALQSNVNGIFAVESESDTPVTGNSHGIGSLAVARQRVKPVSLLKSMTVLLVA